MGTMTRTEMEQEILFGLGNRTDLGATDADRLTRWVIQAYNYMTHPSIHKFRETQDVFTITLASGDHVYDLAVGTVGYHIVAVRWVSYVQSTAYTAGVQKRKVYPRDVKIFERRTLNTGQPNLYTLDGQEIRINGIPRVNENGHLLRVGVYREPVVLGAGDSTPFLGYYDRPLWKFGLSFAQADLGDVDLAMVTAREAQNLLNGAQPKTELEAEDSGWQVEFNLSPVMGVV
jgi:hypothetical protein